MLAAIFLFAGAAWAQSSPAKAPAGGGAPPTVAQATRFIEQAETRLLDLWIKESQAEWVADNFITDDTEALSADADQSVKAATADLAHQARRFDGLKLPPDVTNGCLGHPRLLCPAQKMAGRAKRGSRGWLVLTHHL
jgi:hypothetical protein